MTDLQTAFYIIAIVFMSLSLLLLVIMVIAVVVIRAKLTAIHRHIDEKLSTLTAIADKGGAVVDVLKKVSGKVKR